MLLMQCRCTACIACIYKAASPSEVGEILQTIPHLSFPEVKVFCMRIIHVHVVGCFSPRGYTTNKTDIYSSSNSGTVLAFTMQGNSDPQKVKVTVSEPLPQTLHLSPSQNPLQDSGFSRTHLRFNMLHWDNCLQGRLTNTLLSMHH